MESVAGFRRGIEHKMRHLGYPRVFARKYPDLPPRGYWAKNPLKLQALFAWNLCQFQTFFRSCLLCFRKFQNLRSAIASAVISLDLMIQPDPSRIDTYFLFSWNTGQILDDVGPDQTQSEHRHI
jgi:hypothetical protein